MNKLFINKISVDLVSEYYIKFLQTLVKNQKIILVALVGLCAFSNCLEAQTIWNGPKIIFTKSNFDNPNDAASQDRITPNVWITRGAERGIFNIKQESEYVRSLSPADTEWSFGTTANISNLTFADWQTAVRRNPPSMVNQDMVVHLISEDIYIDIKFLNWEQQAGGFSYERSTPNIPAPETSVQSLSIVDVANNQVVDNLEPSSVINLGDFAEGFGIVANTLPGIVGSVRFFLNDVLISNENIAPYSFSGDLSGTINAVDLAPGGYELRATPFTERNGGGEEGNSLTVNFEVIDQGVQTFVLINVTDNQPVGLLQEGDIIDLSNYPDGFGIVANTEPEVVGSVQFFLDGVFTKNENIAPYSLAGDANGIIHPINIAPGNYELRATSFAEPRGNGVEGTSLAINFTVIRGAQRIRELAIIDVANNQVAEVLTNGALIDLANYPDGFGIVANTNPGVVGSVQFFLDGVFIKNENIAPYSLAGDVNGVINSVSLTPGAYELSATPFANRQGGGAEGTSLTVNFDIVDGGTLGAIIRFSRIDTENETVTLKNFGTEEANISAYWLCLGPGAYNLMSDYANIIGDLSLAPDEEVMIDLSSGSQNVQALPDANGALGLFSSTAFSSNSPEVVLDYVQWGAANQNRIGQAVNAGRWSNASDFVVGNTPYHFVGGAFDVGSVFWQNASSAALNAYPNPNPGTLYIEGQSNQYFVLKNTQGEIIYEGVLNNDKTTLQLNPGAYFIFSDGEVKRILVK